MATTPQILSIARKKLLESGTEILDDETLLIYANFAYQDLIKRIYQNSNISSAVVTFTNGVGTLPTDFGTLYGDAYINSASIFPEVSIQEFTRESSGACVTIENGTMKVFPVSTATLNIKYYKTFADLTLVVNPTIDTYFHELIIYGIMARAHEDLQDEQLSKYFTEKFELEFTKRRSAISEYEEDNQRGSQMFSYTPLISEGGVSDSFW